MFEQMLQKTFVAIIYNLAIFTCFYFILTYINHSLLAFFPKANVKKTLVYVIYIFAK